MSTVRVANQEFTLLDGFRELDTFYDNPKLLMQAIANMRLRHYRELPVSYELSDLYRIGVENSWLTETPEGGYRIQVPDTLDNQPSRLAP